MSSPDSSVAGRRRRFFFVHVHKAAGTELREKLKRIFAPHALYPDASDGDLFKVAPQVSVAQLLERWESRQAEIEVVTGHFPLATVELLDADFVTLTVLREPVERTLSQLSHYRKLTPGVQDQSLETIYDETVLHGVSRNHMVKMFSLTADEVAASAAEKRWAMLTKMEFTPERLARAKQEIARVDVLGLQDRFDEFCEELEARFGWVLGDPLYANRIPHEEVSSAFRARIAADNAMDIEFFEFARGLYEQRL